MGFCLGGKWCRNQKCKDRCRSWFGTMGDVMDSCKGACNSGNTDFSRDEFLCSGDYVDINSVMLRYKIDPCPSDSITLPGLLDPLDSYNEEQRRIKAYTPILVGIGVLFIIMLLIIPTKKAKA